MCYLRSALAAKLSCLAISLTLLLLGSAAAGTRPRRHRAVHAATRRRHGETATPRRRAPPERPVPPAPPAPQPPVRVTGEPTGFARFGRGPETVPAVEQLPLPDRWRAGWPRYERYPGATGESVYRRGTVWNPYDLNLLKGDYPILGRHVFLVTTLRSDTLVEGHRLPVPSGVSAARPDSEQFFGKGEQLAIDQNFIVSLELFHGDAAFKPRDWEVRVTPVFNLNYVDTRENGLVNVDVRRGTDRLDGHVALQELFGDWKIADVSPYYDTVNVRGGIQGFVSDFRGFLFADFQPGLKLSGNRAANRWQWNLVYFRQLEKDTNSGLDTVFADRHQNVAIANVLRQDTFWPGYTAQLSAHYNGDDATRHFDENGFLVRPAAIGDVRPHAVRVGYLGWTGDGHIQRIGIEHAFYDAIGHDTRNPIAGRPVDIHAQMAALELSYDRDWLRFKGSLFWASGDRNPTDGTARGFDAIVDNPLFAGGPFSFWQRQGIKLADTNVNLTSPFSLLPSLRSSKSEGQANFVNPGLFLFNTGVAAKLTPKLVAELNVNYVRFQETAPLKLVLFQRRIGHEVGVDYGVGLRYRPLLIDNIILVAGIAGFSPLGGFQDIYGARTLWQAFGAATFTY